MLLLVSAAPTLAQQGGTPDNHWAFAAFFGTGWYRISGDRSVFVMRVPPRQTLATSSFDADGERRLGIEIHYPLTFGLNQVDELPGLADIDNFGSVSFTPGVELEIPLTARWYLRPFAHVGWGKETDGGASAWIWYGGVKSRYTPPSKRLDWSLLGGLYYAGYDPDDAARNELSTAMLGAEFHQPLGRAAAERDWSLDWHLTYTWLYDEAEFVAPRTLGTTVSDQWEFGLALRRPGRDLRLGGLHFEHAGLSFRWSSDGEYRASALNLRSPFSR